MRNPAVLSLIEELVAMEPYGSFKPSYISQAEENYIKARYGDTNPTLEQRAEVHLATLQASLVYLAENFLRSDEYKKLLAAELDNSEYSSIHEWEVPMVPLFLDKDKVKVDSINISMSNRIANIQLQLQDEPTHQHIGSGDTSCQISLTVIGEEDLHRLVQMVDRVQALSRYERANACLGFWGIKNVLTSLTGMKYCLPVSITYNTVPGQPHLYKVMLELIDFDILQQRREMLSQTERDKLVNEFGKMNPFLRLKQCASYFNCYPDLPLGLYNGKDLVGFLEPDFYYVATARETLRWINEKEGGIVSQDATGDKNYPWPNVNANLLAITGPDIDTDHLSTIVLSRMGGDGEMKIGVNVDPINEFLKQTRASLEGSGLSAEDMSAKLEEEQRKALAKAGITDPDLIEASIRGEDVTSQMIYLDYLGERQKSLSPEAVAHNPFFQDDIAKNYDAMLENLAVTDLRGRMIRAFPTYYLLLIDEGGYLFSYKLFDDFYGLSSVIDFSIHMSEDVVGDTLVMRLANYYGKLSSPIVTGFNRLYADGADFNMQTQWNFNRNLGTKLTNKTGYPIINEAGEIIWTALDHIELQPGVRVQLRAGYSSNINNLPTLFNGVITEISAGDIMTVTCQSDGIELLAVVNAGEKDGHTGSIDGAWFSGWDLSEPRDLFIQLLTFGGSVIRQAVASATRGAVMGDSRYGIRHFGCILWNPNPDDPANELKDGKESVIWEMMEQYKLFLGARDKLDFEKQPTGMPTAISTMLMGEENVTDMLKQAFANMAVSRDTEIFKRNIYPGNMTGVVNQVGVDKQQTIAACFDEIRGAIDNVFDVPKAVTGGAFLGRTGGAIARGAISGVGAAGAVVKGHPLLSIISLVGLSFAESKAKHFVGDAQKMIEDMEAQQTQAGQSILEILNLKDDEKSGPEDPFCEISMQLYTYQRTVWDLMSDCAALLPNYIVAVRPWEHRSTIFYGKPHWVYTSGVWPMTSGANMTPKLTDELEKYIDALVKEEQDKDRFAQEIAKGKVGEGTSTAPSSAHPTIPNNELTNYMSINEAGKLSTYMTNKGMVGPDGTLPNTAATILEQCQFFGVNPALVLGIAVAESGWGLGKEPGAVASNPERHALFGMKWSPHYEQYGGYQGDASSSGGHWAYFRTWEGGMKASIEHIRKYIDGFQALEEGRTDAEILKNGLPYQTYWYDDQMLLSICSMWSDNAGTSYEVSAGQGGAWQYRDTVEAAMKDILENSGSGLNAPDSSATGTSADMTQTDRDVATNYLYKSDSRIINEYVYASHELKAIISGFLPYNSITATVEGAEHNEWLDLFYADPNWWKHLGEDGNKAMPNIVTLLILMKMTRYIRGTSIPAMDSVEKRIQYLKDWIGNPSTNLQYGISEHEMNNLIFSDQSNTIAQYRNAHLNPTTVDEVNRLSDTWKFWSFYDFPTSIDYVTNDCTAWKGAKGRRNFLPEYFGELYNGYEPADMLSGNVYGDWNRITSAAWYIRSADFRAQLHKYYDPAISAGLDYGATDIRAKDDKSWPVFEDLFRKGELQEDDHVSGEFFNMWFQAGVADSATWPTLLVEYWDANKENRPPICDAFQDMISQVVPAEFENNWFIIEDVEVRSEGDFHTDKIPSSLNTLGRLVFCIAYLWQIEVLIRNIRAHEVWDILQDWNYNILLSILQGMNQNLWGDLSYLIHLVEERAVTISSTGINIWSPITEGYEDPSDTIFFKNIIPLLESLIHTIALCILPAMYVPVVENPDASDEAEVSIGGIYLPAWIVPIEYPENVAGTPYDHLPHVDQGIWAAPDLGDYLFNQGARTKEGMMFDKYSVRAAFRHFLNEIFVPNDWAISWIATTSSLGKWTEKNVASTVGSVVLGTVGAIFGTGIAGTIQCAIAGAVAGNLLGGLLGSYLPGDDIVIDEGQTNFKPLASCFSVWLRAVPETNYQKRDIVYQWMLENNNPGNQEDYWLASAILGATRSAFRWIEQFIKKLWGLALMGSGGMATGLSVARFMGNFSNILDKAYNDSIYFQAGLADNPFSREFGEPVVEIREPFQKFWIIDSYSDIIDNKMICSSENVYTVVTAISGGGNPQTVYCDRSIYPENQKEKVVETYLRWEDPKWYELIDNVIDGLKDRYLLDKGCPYDVQAKRVAAYHLKESLKDMYGGEIFIIGRSEIRPHDIMYICDLYENIFGLVEVEAVTHHFSVETGFITSITPNALVSVNDPGKWNFAAQLHAAGTLMAAHKNLKQSTTSAMREAEAKMRRAGFGPGTTEEQAYQDALESFKGGYADWLFNMSKGITPSYDDILNSSMESVGSGLMFTTNGQGVAQSQMNAVIDWFLNHDLVKTQKWVRKAEVNCQIYIPLIGSWIGGLFGMVDNAINWFQENFIDYHPLSMFLVLKKNKPWAAGINGHAGLVVGTIDKRSILPGLVGGLIDLPTGDFVKPSAVLGKLGYSSTDSVNLVRSINIFHTDAIMRAEQERGRVEVGVIPIGVAPIVQKATILGDLAFNESDVVRPKGVCDGDTFYCSVGGSNLPTKIRLAVIDCREFNLAGTWVDENGNEHPNEIGGVEGRNQLVSMLPATGQEIWLRINPYNRYDSNGRTIAMLFRADRYTSEEEVASASWEESINYAMYTSLAPLGYCTLITDLGGYENIIEK
jgi:hypothetical protein